MVSKQKNKSYYISVVIPAFNAASTIIRALDSVIAQTSAASITEVIVVDDGSSDNTAAIVREYIKKHKTAINIKLLSKRNGGVSSARNAGMKHASGNWIALLDADDCWDRKKIEVQLSAISGNEKIRFIGSNAKGCSTKYGKKISKGLYMISFNKYMLKTFPYTSSILFDKSMLKDVGYFDENQRHSEDANLFMRMVHLYNCFYCVDQLYIPDDKPMFGHSGLSANLKAMHNGCLKNINDAYILGYYGMILKVIFITWECIRYSRRIILTSLRCQLGKVRLWLKR